MRRERRRLASGKGPGPAGTFRPGMYLLMRELRELARLAALTPLEREAFEHLLAGGRPHRLAERRGCSREAVRRVIQRMRRKLIRAAWRFRWWGLWEVYGSEVRRR